jgi:hypothetical protein
MAAVNEALNEARGIAFGILDRLDRIEERLQRQLIRDQSIYVTKVLNTLTDTAAQDTVQPPPGVLWIVKRVAVTSGLNGGFAMYLNEAQPQNLIDGSFTNAAMDAWTPGDENGLYIPDGNVLVLRFFAQPNNQPCTVNMRITEVQPKE